MSRKSLTMLLLIISCSIHAIAQTFYYYKGEKISLTISESKVCVNIPKECDDSRKRILASVEVLSDIKDDNFDIYVISRSDLERLTSMDFWVEDSKSVIITNGYLTANNEEVFATPYLNVKLKKEQDIDLLTSYVEKYKLKMVRQSSLMPLWYILNVTLDSEKGPLECANEIFESGDFESSVPDLVSGNSLDQAAKGKEPVPPFYFDENDHYVYYTGTNADRQFASELVYTLRETEEIGGHVYYIVYDRLSVMGSKKTYTIHMREDKGRLLVRLDEYMRFMEKSRGRDMTVFSTQCQYEVTDENEMVLYDFNMKVGDKFRSVEGREDVAVTRIGSYTKATGSGQETRNLIYLSNGSYLLDRIGYVGDVNSQSVGIQFTGDYFDYLNTGNRKLKLMIAQEGTNCLYGNSGGIYKEEYFNGIESVNGDVSRSQKVYDLSGREVRTPSSPGVYIRAGKKYVVK